MKQKGAGSQCVRRKNIGSLSFCERYLSLRNVKAQSFGKQMVVFFVYRSTPIFTPTFSRLGKVQMHLALLSLLNQFSFCHKS